ncbi:hypothetical protein B0H16DRAFT_1598738 [Mycena metata]|uniref:Uncharacterized protein n=1 Tax=Mycena metata TaxID=1033252 RepID=A0AAD7HMI2_9AGAR|nr:hypothetical protein B0H16DRAFT_1598738 [Mycena metata]
MVGVNMMAMAMKRNRGRRMTMKRKERSRTTTKTNRGSRIYAELMFLAEVLGGDEGFLEAAANLRLLEQAEQAAQHAENQKRTSEFVAVRSSIPFFAIDLFLLMNISRLRHPSMANRPGIWYIRTKKTSSKRPRTLLPWALEGPSFRVRALLRLAPSLLFRTAIAERLSQQPTPPHRNPPAHEHSPYSRAPHAVHAAEHGLMTGVRSIADPLYPPTQSRLLVFYNQSYLPAYSLL